MDGGTVQVFLLWLCCSGYGTIEMVGGWSVFLFTFFSLLSALLAGGCLWCGSFFFIMILLDFILVYLSVSYLEVANFVFIRYRWWRKGTDQEGYEPLLEQTQLEHRRLDLETRIEEFESDVRALKDNHVMLEDGEKKDAIFSEICSLESQIFQLKSELATVNSLLSAYD